ncbi:uncharacterized protein H6S33_010842 [Morchella sextelata]|uniref:uncharacterized protein n=1 Tax=Morchella sextelata TaxID=1174677 RepID=UPI001D052779|nr:uncharacterized protein H6S33_010842 [Morchella sextelata]KAH0611577.1 hypothetical protein H6S33_010842 [Morchella sextelata]
MSMSTTALRTKPNTIAEGLQRLRPTFLVAEILARFSREITETEDLACGFGHLSMGTSSYLLDDRDGGEERKWQPEGSHPHVLELRAHYMRDPTAILALKTREEDKEPEVDPNVEIDESPQPRWRIHNRVPQVGKTWSAVRALKESKARENARP